MRTTFDLPDDLFREAKTRAAEQGRTLTSLVREAMMQYLSRSSTRVSGFKLKLVTSPGGLPPGLDVSDRDALEDFLSDA